ncbi:DNA polymerase III subunit beta [Candidatus Daviesbacteria bacterium]|nr:DNA polymerase III subunit beta [Candidatus Daviesbacteria bacterium]
MKVLILQQDLLPALQAVSRSVGVRSTLPVLANVLLQTENGKLKISATNLEVGVIKQLNAKVDEIGEVSVPAKTLLEIVSSLPVSELTLSSSTDQLKISTPSFKASLNGIPASEFPAIPLASDQAIFLEASVLKNTLPQLTFAAAIDEGRPVLTGILTEIKDGMLELVATDGFRLAHKKTTLASKDSFKALIPRKTFEEIVRLIDEELSKDTQDEKIQIATSENQNQIIFKIGQTQLSSRLIEGQFPSWEKIVPTQSVARVVLDRSSFQKSVKLASVFAKDGASIIKLQTGENSLKLISEAKELGNQETDVEAQVEGQALTIAFNSKFLFDALSACSSSQIVIEFSGELSPALLKPVGEEGLEYVIMPVRLS